MPSRQLLVPARYYVRLGEILQRYGVDVGALMQAVGLSDRDLQQADAQMAFGDVDRLVVRAVEASQRSELGFELGKLLSVSTHSVVGFGMLSSATLDDALRFVSRYFRLVMPSFRLRYTGSADRGEMLFTPVVAMSPVCLNFHLETIAIAALRDIDDLASGRRPPCRLTLSIPEPLHRSRYAELRGVTCRFDSEAGPGPFVRLEISENLRQLPLLLSDPNALQVAEERCRALVRQVTEVRQLSEWMVMTIRDMGEGVPTLEEMAKMLNLSTRTLNRYLEREGTSYRTLAGTLQFEIACERLSSGAHSVTEIGYSLGFRDSANFTRAFRNRAGCSPSEYRRRLVSGVLAAPSERS
ncbi:MAG TPA: AraC family transcriptional regulator ligand-binding domain-containing protein [Solimonas sp.]